MRELKLTEEQTRDIRSSEYADAKKNPEKCGPTLESIDFELAQLDLSFRIKKAAREIRSELFDIARGKIDFPNMPFVNLKLILDEELKVQDTVEGMYEDLSPEYQARAWEDYKQFSADSLNVRRKLEKTLNEMGDK